MKPTAKPRFRRFNGQELIRICNEKMICAARDLAEFTKNGINASYIVALAHKCENLEGSMNKTQAEEHALTETEREIEQAVQHICEMGQKIWSHDPTKFSDYTISPVFRTGYPGRQ